ncbi:MAG: glycoside hydrolase 100 family protein [Saprospiraceae bacterium]
MNSHACFLAARRQLLAACVPEGILASTQVADNYRRVWSRDAVVAGLAALSMAEPLPPLVAAFRSTLLTLAEHQHATGQIPSNVAFSETGRASVSYGGLSGRVDATAWFALGCGYYSAYALQDEDFRNQIRPALERAFAIMDAWEFNGRHLMYVPMGGNWADEYLLQGYTLYDNTLRLAALEMAANNWGRTDWAEKARCIRETMHQNFWLGTDRPNATYHPVAMQRADERPYWAAAFSPNGYDTRFDLWGNALAMIFDLGNSAQRSAQIGFMEALTSEYRGLMPVFYPVIKPGDTEWPSLQNHFAYRFKNHPHHFHNGGIWPIALGFAGVALAKHGATAMAARLLDALNDQIEQDGLLFHEYLASDVFEWAGTTHLSFSAAGYALLHEAVVHKHSFLPTNAFSRI